jgi:Family of unknown function (DUF5988)
METVSTCSVPAILEGGPESIPEASRTTAVDPREEKIKLPHYGGYEHFERAGWLDDGPSPRSLIYRWTMRTKVAE